MVACLLMWCSVQKDNHWAVLSSPQILVWLDWLTHNALWHPILHHQNLILRKTKTIFLIIHLGDFIEHVHSNLPLMATSLQWPLFLSQWAVHTLAPVCNGHLPTTAMALLCAPSYLNNILTMASFFSDWVEWSEIWSVWYVDDELRQS